MGSEFEAVLRDARAGRSEAWERLYKSLSPLVLGYFRSRRIPDAEDLLGEVFLGVVKDLPRFEGEERAFRAWVLTIAHRRLVDRQRNWGRRPREESRAEIHEDLVPPGDVESEALSHLGTEHIRGLISSLSPEQQDVLLLRILGDLSVDEVAEIMGKRPGAIRALQHRGLVALRKRLMELRAYQTDAPERLPRRDETSDG